MGRLAAMLIIAMAGALALAGCNIGGLTATAEGDGDANGDEDRETLAIPVEVELPHRSDISAYFETTTRVEAEHRVEVMAEAVGRASSIHVDEGDIVNQGDILAELDKREAESSLRQTEVQLRQHRTELDRARRGYELGIIPRAEYESARFAYEQSLASLESQRIQLDHLTVRAPIAGIVTELHARTGSMISSGSPLCTIVDPNSYRLVINPPERELGRLAPGQEASVRIDALQGREFTAQVARINPSVDPASGTVRVVMRFDGAGAEELREAAFARVSLVMDTHEDALLVPKDAILEETARRYVYVVRPAQWEEDAEAAVFSGAEPEIDGPMEAHRIEVETGLEDSYFTEIVSGIDDDALVVVMGQHNLRHGATVRITDAEEALRAQLNLTPEEALERARERRADGGSR